MAVQRKLEILADANPARDIPEKALPFIALNDHSRHCEPTGRAHARPVTSAIALAQ